MRRFYAPSENFSGGIVELDSDETRHLRDVLRLREGDSVNVFDGRGREFRCTVEAIEKKRSLLAINNEISPSSPESPLDLTLAIALLKADKTDLVIQKAVELGVTSIRLLLTDRCDVKVKANEKRLERWRKIAFEAMKQCGRAKHMSIENVIGFDAFIGSAGTENNELLLFTERGGSKMTDLQVSGKLTAVIGPEGGWEDSELELANGKGCKLITLGGRILRAETAAISIAAILQHRLGDLN